MGSLFLSLNSILLYMSTRYDYIVAGAGCAGLGLVWKLLTSELRDKRILILDPDLKEKNDRTWCFWDTEKPDLPCEPDHSWDKLSLSTEKHRGVYSTGAHTYYHLEGSSYYQSIKELIRQFPNVEWKQEAVLDFNSRKGEVEVETIGGTYAGEWAFSSMRTRPESAPASETRLQHFKGLFIKTERPVFNSEVVDLMDFRIPQLGDVRFFYLLPFSETEALIEFTVFSTSVWEYREYQVFLDEYLENLRELGSGEITIERTEQGVIPMATARYETWRQPRVLNMGLSGGSARPGTGYAFQFIQDRNKEIVASLESSGIPYVGKTHRPRHEFYDALLLRVMDKEPEMAAAIFSRLFRKHPASRVLSFLSEKTSFLTELHIMASLQWPPFLRALVDKLLYVPVYQPDSSSVSGQRQRPAVHAHRS